MYRSILFICLTFFFYSAIAAEQLIEDPAKVAQLKQISAQLNSVSISVTSCLDQGTPHRQCLCENRDKVDDFNQTVKAMDSSNINWEGLDLVRYRSDEGEWVTLSLAGLRRQAGHPMNCP